MRVLVAPVTRATRELLLDELAARHVFCPPTPAGRDVATGDADARAAFPALLVRLAAGGGGVFRADLPALLPHAHADAPFHRFVVAQLVHAGAAHALLAYLEHYALLRRDAALAPAQARAAVQHQALAMGDGGGVAERRAPPVWFRLLLELRMLPTLHEAAFSNAALVLGGVGAVPTLTAMLRAGRPLMAMSTLLLSGRAFADALGAPPGDALHLDRQAFAAEVLRVQPALQTALFPPPQHRRARPASAQQASRELATLADMHLAAAAGEWWLRRRW